MTDQTEKLKALALAATKGPWMRLFGERTVYDRMEDGCRGNAIVRADVGYGSQDASNLDFIAASNPAAVLELIAEVERYRWIRKVEHGNAAWDMLGSGLGGSNLDAAIDAAIAARTGK